MKATIVIVGPAADATWRKETAEKVAAALGERVEKVEEAEGEPRCLLVLDAELDNETSRLLAEASQMGKVASINEIDDTDPENIQISYNEHVLPRAPVVTVKEPEFRGRQMLKNPPPAKTRAPKNWKCMECGKRFTLRAAEKAFSSTQGCPKCGGADIQIDELEVDA